MLIVRVLDVYVHVEREEQWGENTALRSSSADRTGAGCVCSCRERRAVGREHGPEELLPVCQEAVDPVTDGGGHGELS